MQVGRFLGQALFMIPGCFGANSRKGVQSGTNIFVQTERGTLSYVRTNSNKEVYTYINKPVFRIIKNTHTQNKINLKYICVCVYIYE